MVWDPARITPKTWESVIEFYAQIAARNHDFVPLRDLGAHVLLQAYVPSLSAATSGTTLLVARRRDPDWVVEALRIDIGLDGSVHFRPPVDGRVRPPAFRGDGTNIVRVFERFLGNARWIDVKGLRAGA